MAKTNDLNQPTSETAGVPRRFTVVMGAFLPMAAAGIVIFSFGVFFKPVSAQFGWTRAEISGAFSLASIINGIGGLILGRISDRFNPRIIIVACGTLEGIAYLLLAHISAIWQLYFYYGVLVGAGMANIVPATSLVARYFKRQRGLMTGITMAGAAIGAAVAPPLATQLISHYSWSTSYVVIGVITLIITLGAAIFLGYSARIKPPPEERQAAVDRQIGGSLPAARGLSLTQAIRGRTFWCLGLILFCAGLAQQIITVHIIPYATDLKISPGSAAMILTVVNGACLAGSFIFGQAIDRLSSKTSLLMAMAILLAASLWLIVANALWTFFLFAAIFGIAWGGTSVLRPNMVAELFGMRAHGVITGAVLLVSVIGGTLGPILAGYIFDVSGHYRTALLMVAGLNVVGLLTAVFLKYRQR